MARIGFFGGTFDPPHIAHMMAALYALQTGQVDMVLVAPAANHAFGKRPRASFGHRVAMCRIATAHFRPGTVEVSDIEGRRDGISYTVDTLRTLAAERPGDTFRLLAGSDVVGDLPKWRESTAVLRLAPVLEIPRATLDARTPAPPGALPALSSTHIRDRLADASDHPIHLLDAAVMEYIRQNDLYGPPL